MTAFQQKSFSVAQRGRSPEQCSHEWVRLYRGGIECVQCGHRESQADYLARVAREEAP